jgi:transcription-repair coupling factor (superfamily II helicase)
MRDLEIRGAGNLLGESQSGHISAVGYDLYCQMVTEAVAEMKGEPVLEVEPEIKIDIAVDAYLPDTYVPSEELRLEAYRRLATVRTAEELTDIETEWRDRFGPLPDPAQALLSVGALRAQCHRLGITEVLTNGREIRIFPVELRASQTMALRRLASRAVYKEQNKVISLPVTRGTNTAILVFELLHELFDPDDN